MSEEAKIEVTKQEAKPEWLIEEYKDIGEGTRHDDIVGWTIGGILIVAALGAMALAIQSTDPSARRLWAFGSISLIWLWFFIRQRYAWYTQRRYDRAREIEKMLGLRQHIIIKEADSKLRILPLDRLLDKIGLTVKIHYLTLILAVGLTLLWVFLFK